MSDYIYRVMPEVSPGVFRSRPVGGSPGYEYKRGEWTPGIKNPVECERGYHTLSAAGLLGYVREGDAIVRCRYRGQVAGSSGKAVNERVMPVEVVGYATARALRLTAADAAESVLPIYKRYYSDDPTLDVVIHTARAYALGGASKDDLTAARVAARVAAWAAAGPAARAAAGAAAWAAAGPAAGVAAGAAAGHALLRHAAEEMEERR